MPGSQIRVEVNGTALQPAARNRIINTGIRRMLGVVTGHGVSVVRDRYTVFRNPTGYYESRTVAKVSGDPFMVWDSDVVYGPWLEGISRRNATTRFKGYHSFRKATQQIQRDVPRVVAPVLNHMVGQLNR